MLSTVPAVFLLDVDNSLLDNDRFAADLTAHLDAAFGKPERERYWAIYAELRQTLGYADYLAALQTFRQDSAESFRNQDPLRDILRDAHYIIDEGLLAQ